MIENGKLETNLYIKPTNLQLYLDFFSNHPEPCKEGVVYGQALRILERCSKTEDAEKHLDDLKSKLKNRNYPEELISKKFYEAKKKPRKDLIFQKRSQTQKDDKVRLIFTHNKGNRPYTSGSEKQRNDWSELRRQGLLEIRFRYLQKLLPQQTPFLVQLPEHILTDLYIINLKKMSLTISKM